MTTFSGLDVVTAYSMGTNKCGWCGMYHGPTCPRVSAIEYHPNGQVKRVEFFDATGANGRRVGPLVPATRSRP